MVPRPRAGPGGARRRAESRGGGADERCKDAGGSGARDLQLRLGTTATSASISGGPLQPHAAAEVLANQYGDCKDKDTLLEALLHAKGFTTTPALIGAGIAPVPEVPSPAVFNHVITTVNLAGGRFGSTARRRSRPIAI